MNQIRTGKKQRASIVLTISIFILAIIIFSICAIDAGYIVTSRYKTQKITETLALYMASSLNSLPPEKRNEEAVKNIKENFEKLYSEHKISGYWNFKITDIEIKDKEATPKIKVSTQTLVPPLFLRFARVGLIKINQTAYAKSEEASMPYISSLSKKEYYTFKAKNIITDKWGEDLKVEYDGGYFAFAGLEDSNGEILWTEIGSLISGPKTEFTLTDKVTGDKFKAYCIENTNTFDLNSDHKKTIGLVKYLRIYKMDCSTEEIPAPTETETEGGEDVTPDEGETTTESKEKTGEESEGEEDDSPTGTPPVVTILNSVKLIKKSDF